MKHFTSTLLTLICIFIAINPAFALDINNIRFGTHPDKQRIVIELNEKAEFRAFTMNDPHRLVVDLPRFTFKAININRPPNSLITDIRHGPVGTNNGKSMSRLVLQTQTPILVQSAFTLPKDNSQPNRIVIDFIKTSDETSLDTNKQTIGTLTNKPEEIVKEPSPNKNPIIAKNKTKPVIILDPGHGGQDSGAISVHGVYEKNIVLAVGKELRSLLENSGQYTVRMTREKDVFIPLRDRVRFARKQNGDLFLSLHADSIRSADVTGASVYTLSEKASDKEAEKLAERENKSDLIAGVNLSNQENDVTSILIDLASRETMNQSRFLANTIVKNLDNGGVDVLDRSPHRSAGFAVLKALDIPSALVEMGYLTNEQEAKKLSSPEHHKKIARALKASIDDYFTRVATLQGE